MSQSLPILTMGSRPSVSPALLDCSTNSNLELLRKGSQYSVSIRSGPAAAGCPNAVTSSNTITEGQKVHLVLTVDIPDTNTGFSDVTLTLNAGTSSPPEVVHNILSVPETDLNAGGASSSLPYDFVPDYTQWATGQYLQLFTDKRATFDKGGTYGPWPGTIYLLAVYDRVLTSTEIRANYDYGECTDRVLYLLWRLSRKTSAVSSQYASDSAPLSATFSLASVSAI